jgi:hypothetical protein
MELSEKAAPSPLVATVVQNTAWLWIHCDGAIFGIRFACEAYKRWVMR